MSVQLEQRVNKIEKELVDLKKSLQVGHPEKDWRRTFGLSRDDSGFDEMIRLGQEIRQRDRPDSA
jgi:hypothetical protein